MPVLRKCPICKKDKTSSCCQSLCENCANKNPQFEHNPLCFYALRRKRERAQMTLFLHNELRKRERELDEAMDSVEQLRRLLKEVSPCAHCCGAGCQLCGKQGFRPESEELHQEAKIPDPPMTTG